ncbi:MAG TPA: glutaminyl-peptide cyclotransferase [Pyrinomonadaceae bacterium]|nr:glutaminyl-peptide cyclotransferase [Pyrinomonadaceae bacterium]
MNFRQCRHLLLLAFAFLVAGCGDGAETAANAGRLPAATPPVGQKRAASNLAGDGRAKPVATGEPAPVYSYKIKHAWPHDTQAFTQGLIFLDGVLWESTGQYGSSSLRKVELKTGKVIKMIPVPRDYFAEGMTVFQGKVFQLTWQSHKGFIYDPATFQKQGEFAYPTEGWGLTHDGESLIMSDGSNLIRFLDPTTFQTTRVLSVIDEGGEPVSHLNELEYVKGEIYANIWQTDRIVRVDPKSGKILGWIDLTGLLSDAERTDESDVLNGIAYDAKDHRLFVTGKLWPKLYEIELVKK